MESLKLDKQIILQLLLFVLVSLSIVTVEEPLVTTFFMGLWVGFLGFTIFSKVQYRTGKANYILLPTTQDRSSKLNGWILGTIVLLLSVAAYFGNTSMQEYGQAGILVGFLTILSSLLFVPVGLLKADNQQLELFGLNSPIDIEQIKEIHVHSDYLIVRSFFGEDQVVQQLLLSTTSAEEIKNYLSENKNTSGIEIINHVA